MPSKVQTEAAVETSGFSRRVLGRWILGLALTCVFLASLLGLSVLMAPVSLLTRNLDPGPVVRATYGSVNAGRADLLGGYQLSWQSRVKLLGLPHLATSFVLEGSDTYVTGELRQGVQGVILGDVSGRAGPGLAQWIEGAWRCDMSARLTDVSAEWRWRRAASSGVLRTAAGACTKAGRTLEIPALALNLDTVGRDARATLSAGPNTPMAEVIIRRARSLEIEILPAAADVFVQLPRGGPIRLQLPF